METSRGFVLHSADYKREGTLLDQPTTSPYRRPRKSYARLRRAMVRPRSLMALGYAGWGEGQLDEEIKRNAWLSVPADAELLFSEDVGAKWSRALG